jgi:hypothetical protein
VKGGGKGISRRNWHVDLACDYVTHFSSDIGLDISFKFRDYGMDKISREDFIAEPVHFPVWGAAPSHDVLERICRIAAALFARRYLKSGQARHQRPRGRTTTKDAA